MTQEQSWSWERRVWLQWFEARWGAHGPAKCLVQVPTPPLPGQHPANACPRVKGRWLEYLGPASHTKWVISHGIPAC